MTSLVERLDALQISDEKSRTDMFGFIYRTKKAKQYFLCSDHWGPLPLDTIEHHVYNRY